MQMFKQLDKVEYDSLKILLKHNEALINNDPFALAETSKVKTLKNEPKGNNEKGRKTTSNIQKILSDVPKDPRQDKRAESNLPLKAEEIIVESLSNPTKIGNKSLSYKEFESHKEIRDANDTSGSFLRVNPYVMRKLEELEDSIRHLNESITKTNERFDIYYSIKYHRRSKDLDASQNGVSIDEKSADMKIKHDNGELTPHKGSLLLNNVSPGKANMDSSYIAENENKSFLLNDNDPRGVKLKIMFSNVQKQIDEMKSKLDFLSMSASSSKSPSKSN